MIGPHLPVPLQGAEFTDLHATGPAFAIGWAATDFTSNDQLCGWVTVDSHVGKIIQKNSFTSLSLQVMLGAFAILDIATISRCFA